MNISRARVLRAPGLAGSVTTRDQDILSSVDRIVPAMQSLARLSRRAITGPCLKKRAITLSAARRSDALFVVSQPWSLLGGIRD
jgi:hypothetical protein